MSKSMEELKAKVKLLYNIDLDTSLLTDVFGYSTDYQLLNDILDLIIHDLNTII